MTLAADMALDAVEIASTDEFAELVTYYPAAGGTATNRKVIVNRNPPGPDGQLRNVATTYFEVYVPVDATVGLTTVKQGFDKIGIADLKGGTPVQRLVASVIEKTDGFWRLRVAR